MDITIERKVLFDAISLVQSVVERKVTLPCLATFLLEMHDGELSLTATDLEVTMTTTIPATGGPSRIALPAQKVFEILRETDGDTVEITLGENFWAELVCGNASFKLAGLPPDDFPAVPHLGEDVRDATLPGKVLADMLAQTSFAVSHDESRHALCGLCFEFEKDDLRCIATDGHRLACTHTTQNQVHGKPIEIIVPLKGIVAAKKLEHVEEVNIYTHLSGQENMMVFQSGDKKTTLFSRLIDASYVDYKQVLPEKTQYQVEFERTTLQQAIRRVSLLAAESHLLKCVFESGKVMLSASNPQLGDAREQLECSWEGEPFAIGLNARYILDVLSAIKTDTVLLGLNDPTSPALFTPKDGMGRYVIMPMRL